MEVFGKEQNTSVTRTTERTKPTLVTIGKKQVISTGRWNNEIMADYVLANGRSKWLPVGDLARTAYGQNTPRSKERVRKCLNQLFTHFMHAYGELLVTEYGPPHNRAQAVKLYDKTSELERQNIGLKIERMRKRGGWTLNQYEHAIRLLQEKQQLDERNI